MNNVSFIVNVSPFDHQLYRPMLEHQYRAFGRQVHEFLIVYDENPKKIRGEWSSISKKVQSGIADFERGKSNAIIRKVPYDTKTISRVAEFFTVNKRMPLYDFRGAPIYQYLYGLFVASGSYIFHADSDMFFGGLSQTWIMEATDLLRENEGILSVSPLPGPPHPEGLLVAQEYRIVPASNRMYDFNTFSTRVFFLNREHLKGRIHLILPSLEKLLFAFVNGFPWCDTVERSITKLMKRDKLRRRDFLGNDPGMWSLHPQRRSDAFFRELPQIIERVELGNIPPSQRGYYNFSPEFFDWQGVFKSKKK